MNLGLLEGKLLVRPSEIVLHLDKQQVILTFLSKAMRNNFVQCQSNVVHCSAGYRTVMLHTILMHNFQIPWSVFLWNLTPLMRVMILLCVPS